MNDIPMGNEILLIEINIKSELYDKIHQQAREAGQSVDEWINIELMEAVEISEMK